MTIYYDNTGAIYYTVWDRDTNSFSHTTNIPLQTIEIDETVNKALCIDLERFGPDYKKRLNSEGENKYSVVNGELYEVEGWEELIQWEA